MKRGMILGVALAALVVMSSAGIAAAVTKEEAQSQVAQAKARIKRFEDEIKFHERLGLSKSVQRDRGLLETAKADLAYWEKQLNELQHQK